MTALNKPQQSIYPSFRVSLAPCSEMFVKIRVSDSCPINNFLENYKRLINGRHDYNEANFIPLRGWYSKGDKRPWNIDSTWYIDISNIQGRYGRWSKKLFTSYLTIKCIECFRLLKTKTLKHNWNMLNILKLLKQQKRKLVIISVPTLCILKVQTDAEMDLVIMTLFKRS